MKRMAPYYGGALGLLYVVYGVLQVINGITKWWLGRSDSLQLGIRVTDIVIPNAFPDPFSGVTLITVGLLFVASLYHYRRGKGVYRGYLLAAWFLAITLLLLNIVEIAANVLDSYYPLILGLEPEEPWSLANDAWGLAPHMLLGLLALPLYLGLKDMIKELAPGVPSEKGKRTERTTSFLYNSS